MRRLVCRPNNSLGVARAPVVYFVGSFVFRRRSPPPFLSTPMPTASSSCTRCATCRHPWLEEPLRLLLCERQKRPNPSRKCLAIPAFLAKSHAPHESYHVFVACIANDSFLDYDTGAQRRLLNTGRPPNLKRFVPWLIASSYPPWLLRRETRYTHLPLMPKKHKGRVCSHFVLGGKIAGPPPAQTSLCLQAIGQAFPRQ